jgi:hypothetical protein
MYPMLAARARGVELVSYRSGGSTGSGAAGGDPAGGDASAGPDWSGPWSGITGAVDGAEN